jgi:hypothetical protein
LGFELVVLEGGVVKYRRFSGSGAHGCGYRTYHFEDPVWPYLNNIITVREAHPEPKTVTTSLSRVLTPAKVAITLAYLNTLYGNARDAGFPFVATMFAVGQVFENRELVKPNPDALI